MPTPATVPPGRVAPEEWLSQAAAGLPHPANVARRMATSLLRTLQALAFLVRTTSVLFLHPNTFSTTVRMHVPTFNCRSRGTSWR